MTSFLALSELWSYNIIWFHCQAWKIWYIHHDGGTLVKDLMLIDNYWFSMAMYVSEPTIDFARYCLSRISWFVIDVKQNALTAWAAMLWCIKYSTAPNLYRTIDPLSTGWWTGSECTYVAWIESSINTIVIHVHARFNINVLCKYVSSPWTWTSITFIISSSAKVIKFYTTYESPLQKHVTLNVQEENQQWVSRGRRLHKHRAKEYPRKPIFN
jgi:hypothetical protein